MKERKKYFIYDLIIKEKVMGTVRDEANRG